MIRKVLLVAADNKRLEELVSRNRFTSAVVSRYVAGTTLDQAIAVAQELNAKGIDVSLDLLGETVSDLEESAPRHAPTSRRSTRSPSGPPGPLSRSSCRSSGSAWTRRSAPGISRSSSRPLPRPA